MAKKKRKAEKSKQLKSSKAVNAPQKKETSPTPIPPPIKGLTRIQKLLALLVLLGLCFILYGKSISYGYVLDDKLVYTDNKFTKAGMEGIGPLLSTESFTGYFGDQKNLVQGSRYRPLSLISFNIEHQIFGISSSVSHAINILLYAICGWICFLCLARLFKEDNVKVFLGLAFVTALIFILHPLHVEAVANVKGRDEILSLLLSMLTFYGILKYVDYNKLIWLLLGGLYYFLGLLAKENTLTFLAIIPFGLILFRPAQKKKLLIATTILLLLSLAYIALRYSVIGFLLGDAPSNDLMNNSFAGMNGAQKYATIFYTLLEYLRLNVFPHPLTHDYYPYHIPKMEFSDWQVWFSILLHLILAGVALIYWKKHKVITFAIGFYFAAISIVSNIVISIGTFMNERFAFSASLGACLLMAYLIKNIGASTNTFNLKKSGVILLPLIIFYSYKTFLRVPAWENELALNTAAIKVSKNSARANSFMATALFNKFKTTTDPQEQQRLLDQAGPYAKKSVEIHGVYYNGNLMRIGVASEQHKRNRDTKALLDEFLEVIQYRPDVDFIKTYLEYINPREDKNVMLNFYKKAAGDILINETQKYDWAVFYLQLGMQVDQNDPELRSLMRKAYMGLGKPGQAQQYK